MDTVLTPDAFDRARILAQAFVDEVNAHADGPVVTIAALQMTVINVLYPPDPDGKQIDAFIRELRKLANNACAQYYRAETLH